MTFFSSDDDSALMVDNLTDLGFSPYFMSQLSLEELQGAATPYRLIEIQRSIVTGLGTSGTQILITPHNIPTSAFGVGDWVLADAENRIIRRLEPKSELKRRAAGSDVSEQIMAANVDTLFIVTSCNDDFNLARIERFLALANESGVIPIVLITKTDLVADADSYNDQARNLMAGLEVIALDARSADVTQRLAPWFQKGQTLAMVGSSGVGKTTLLNTLTGRKDLTQAIRDDDSKGRHTTTYRSLHPAMNGAWLIDMPGIRALRLHEKSTAIENLFDDITELAAQCRFSDCQHISEPGCAVQAAIKSGDLEPERLERWRKLEAEDRRNTETIAQSRRRSKAFGKMVKKSLKNANRLKGRDLDD